MKTAKLRQYQYVKLDNYYFCLQQTPLVFAWLIFWKREDLITIQPWIKKNIAPWTRIYYRYRWNLFKRNIIHLIIFGQCWLGLRKNSQSVYLSVYGHFGLAVHKGYKIFNLRRGVVTKIFDPDVRQASIWREIEQLQKISHIDFAPTLLRWDMEERWYQEEFIRSTIPVAHRSAHSMTLLKAFYQDALPCMNNLIEFQAPKSKDLKEYLNELMNMSEMRRWSTEDLQRSEFQIIKYFLDYLIGYLRGEENISLYLVFSHGDFCPANMLQTRQGIKFIDWESAGNRSALFDFYCYFFYRMVTRKISVDKVASEVNEALPVFISSLAMTKPEMGYSLSHFGRVYRHIFYIEEICKALERERTDKNLNIIEYILRYIDAFKKYEKLLTGKDQDIKCVE